MCYLDVLLFLKKIYLSLKNRFGKMCSGPRQP